MSEITADDGITEGRYDHLPGPNIWIFCTRIYTFSTEFFGLWVKIENMSVCTRMYRKPTEKQAKSR